MVKGKDVIGLKVMTVSDGKEMGKIKDLVYDSNSHEVKALLLDEGGVFSDAKIILVPEIQSIGKDAILIKDQATVKKASEADQVVAETARKDQYLTATKIVSEDGTDLGKVTDLYFDPQTGKVHEFEVSQGFIGNIQSGKKRIRVEDIITVGEDATIVRGYVEEDFSEQGKQQGITGAVETAKNEAPNVMEDIKNKAQGLTQQAKDKVEEIQSSPKTQQLMSDVTQKANEAGEKIRSATEDMKDTIENKVADVRNNPDIQKTKENVEKEMDETAETIKDKSHEMADRVNQKAEEIKSSQIVEDATEKADDTINDVADPTDENIPTPPRVDNTDEPNDTAHIEIDIPKK